ncbi:fimbrillin family protein [Elizabethkingia ursingii]|uniref:fimbrillin family protein n=1 Tax=Elizabethkingia ursingii TaxID=1756150 RepID=UPI000750AB8B|nr:fimbrillin family protein [Elizabethkingia ursingii]KUY29900.1 hypothetical protein ATB96_17650 [Elizabethkingia ursingii]
MKKPLTKTTCSGLFSTLLISGALLLTHCATTDDNFSTGFSSKTAKLEIKISGIESNTTPGTLASRNRNHGQAENRIIHGENTTKLDSFNAIMTMEEDPNFDDKPLLSASAGALLATTNYPMITGHRYRFILYEIKDGATVFKESKDGTAGSPLTFEVERAKTYKWISYSYNSNETITDVIDPVTPTLPTSIDKDLLYASGEITIESQQPSVPIVFRHMLARLKLQLDSTEFIGDILSAGLSARIYDYTELGIGTLNLSDGSISDVQLIRVPETSPKFTAITSANKIGAAPGGSIQEGYYYTADFVNNISHPQVRIDSLQIQSDFPYENHVQTYPWIKRVTRRFNGQITPMPGKSYTLKIKIQNNDGIQNDGLIWARGNLAYNPLTDTYFIQKRAYFLGRQLYQNDYIGLLPFGVDFHDFWAYNSFLPNPAPTSSYSPFPAMDPGAAFNDPCSKVEGGYWRLPTFAEFKSLDDTYGNKWNNNSSNGQAPERDEVTSRSYKYYDIPDRVGNVERLMFYKTGDLQHADGTSGSNIYSNVDELSYMVRDYYNSNNYQSAWSNGGNFTLSLKDYRKRISIRCVQVAP